MKHYQIPEYKQVATPSNPDVGFVKIYFKADNKGYLLDSDGVERPLEGELPPSAGEMTIEFSTTGTDAYSLYGYTTLVDNLMIPFIADVSNSGVATLNFAGTGARDIVTTSGSALADDDIGVGKLSFLKYDLANDRFVFIQTGQDPIAPNDPIALYDHIVSNTGQRTALTGMSIGQTIFQKDNGKTYIATSPTASIELYDTSKYATYDYVVTDGPARLALTGMIIGDTIFQKNSSIVYEATSTTVSVPLDDISFLTEDNSDPSALDYIPWYKNGAGKRKRNISASGNSITTMLTAGESIGSHQAVRFGGKQNIVNETNNLAASGYLNGSKHVTVTTPSGTEFISHVFYQMQTGYPRDYEIRIYRSGALVYQSGALPKYYNDYYELPGEPVELLGSTSYDIGIYQMTSVGDPNIIGNVFIMRYLTVTENRNKIYKSKSTDSLGLRNIGMSTSTIADNASGYITLFGVVGGLSGLLSGATLGEDVYIQTNSSVGLNPTEIKAGYTLSNTEIFLDIKKSSPYIISPGLNFQHYKNIAQQTGTAPNYGTPYKPSYPVSFIKGGSYTVTFDAYAASTTHSPGFTSKVNGVQNEGSGLTTSYVSYSHTINITPGDNYTLDGFSAGTGGTTVYIKNFKISYNKQYVQY